MGQHAMNPMMGSSYEAAAYSAYGHPSYTAYGQDPRYAAAMGAQQRAGFEYGGKGQSLGNNGYDTAASPKSGSAGKGNYNF